MYIRMLFQSISDFIHERNKLAEEVFPHLKNYCSSKGLDFQVIDMRWGVSDMNVSLHQTSEVCLNEIEQCHRMSLGPAFIVSVSFCFTVSFISHSSLSRHF